MGLNLGWAPVGPAGRYQVGVRKDATADRPIRPWGQTWTADIPGSEGGIGQADNPASCRRGAPCGAKAADPGNTSCRGDVNVENNDEDES